MYRLIYLLCLLLLMPATQLVGQNIMQLGPNSLPITKVEDGAYSAVIHLQAIADLDLELVLVDRPIAELPPYSSLEYSMQRTILAGTSYSFSIPVQRSELHNPQTLIIHEKNSDNYYRIPLPYDFILSEIDVDTPGIDAQEFVEIQSPDFPFASVYGLQLLAINGSNEQVSRRWDIDENLSTSNQDGFFIVAGRDLPVSPAQEPFVYRSTTNLLQNGSSSSDEADAVALIWKIEDLDQELVLDALIYDLRAGSEDAGLGELLGMNAAAAIEGVKYDSDQVSLARTISGFGPLKSSKMFLESPTSPLSASGISVYGPESENAWIMTGVADGLNFLEWVNQDFFTQGAPNADVPQGDPLFFSWNTASQSFESHAFTQNLLDHKNRGYFFYGSYKSFGKGVDGWPKQLAKVSPKRRYSDISTQQWPLSEGLNLVANPYPFPLKVGSLFNSHPELVSLVRWSSDRVSYEVLSATIDEWSTETLAPFEAVWAQASSTSTIQLATDFGGAPKLVANSEDFMPFLKLTLTVDGLSSEVVLMTDPLSQSPALLLPPSMEEKSKQPGIALMQDHQAYKSILYSGNVYLRMIAQKGKLMFEHSGEQSINRLVLEQIQAPYTKIELIEGQQIEVSGFDSSSDWRISIPVTTAISEEEKNQMPFAAKVYPNYPNPFNPSTQLPVELSQAGYLRIEIRDIAGRLIQTAYTGFQQAGLRPYSIQMTNSMATGLYFAHVYLDGQAIGKQKMLFIQ